MILIPKISVIVPVYNVEQYLPKCIDSILAQTFTDFELLLIDDGSPDNSGKICDEYAKKDKRIRVFHKENGGVTSAREKGVENAFGEWINFVDSDDFLPNNAIEKLYIAIDSNTDIIIGQYIKVPYNRKMSTIQGPIFIDKIDYCNALLNSKIPVGPVARLIKKNIFDNRIFLLPIEIIHGEDLLMNLRLAVKSNGIRIIPDIVYYYYQRSNSAIHSYKGDFENGNKYYVLYYEQLMQPLEEYNLVEICKGGIIHQKIHSIYTSLTSPLVNKNNPIIKSIIDESKTIPLSNEDKKIIYIIIYIPTLLRVSFYKFYKCCKNKIKFNPLAELKNQIFNV